MTRRAFLAIALTAVTGAILSASSVTAAPRSGLKELRAERKEVRAQIREMDRTLAAQHRWLRDARTDVEREMIRNAIAYLNRDLAGLRVADDELGRRIEQLELDEQTARAKERQVKEKKKS